MPANRTKEIGLTWPLLFLALVALPLPYILSFDSGHVTIALGVGLLICALAFRSVHWGIAAALAYLLVLGDYRRYASFFSGYPGSDPLLLVAPAAALIILGIALGQNRIRGSSGLSAMILLFTLLLGAQIFNPLQGGITVGLGGALFYIVPMLWFWIGRAYGTSEFLVLLFRRVVVPVAVVAAALGIYQSVFGLLPFEASWVKAGGYQALYVGRDVVRAFGFSNSAAEFTRLLMIAEVLVVAAWLRERSWLITLLPVLLVAQLLGTSRTPLVMFLATSVLLWAVQSRRRVAWVPRLAVAGAVGGSVAIAILLAIQEWVSLGRLAPLVSHQVEGLLNPTDPTKSTAVGHFYLGWQGIVEGVTSLSGHGLGATTLAGTKFGSAVFNAEVDVANMFYSLGVVGGVVYVAIMFLVLKSAFAIWRRRRGTAELFLLGVLVSTFLSWLLGGEYAIAAIVWFAVGAVDRAGIEIRTEKRRAAYARSVGDTQGSVRGWAGAHQSQRSDGSVTARLARDAGRH